MNCKDYFLRNKPFKKSTMKSIDLSSDVRQLVFSFNSMIKAARSRKTKQDFRSGGVF